MSMPSFAMLLLLAAAAPPGELKPEAPLGSRIPIPPEQQSADEARKMTAEFADCVVSKHPVEAERYLNARTSKEVEDLIPRVFDADCLEDAARDRDADVQLKIPPEVAKYSLAGALAKRDLAAVDSMTLSKAEPLSYPTPELKDFIPQRSKPPSRTQIDDATKAFDRQKIVIAFEKFGECVVRSNAQGAARLLATEAVSNSESQAFAQMTPSFAGCLEQGAQFSATKAMMRGTVALAYYRLANAPKVVPAPISQQPAAEAPAETPQ